jgi:peptidoglycan/LPS O-acetylase OafA/YrhL
MNRPVPLPEAAERSLANTRRLVLIVLGACGLGVIAMTAATPRPLPSTTDSLVTTLVIALAIGAIAARQIAGGRVQPQTRARCLLAAYGFAAGLGVAGLLFALATGEVLRGVGYVLAGAIFALAGLRVDGATRKRGSP